jgi:hypothetical protein
MFGFEMGNDRLDGGTTVQLAFDLGRHPPLRFLARTSDSSILRPRLFGLHSEILHPP